MSQTASRCTGCDPVTSDEITDPEWPPFFDFVCDQHRAELEQRYTRRPHPTSQETLGDAMLRAYKLDFESQVEPIDPEVREVFGKLSRTVIKHSALKANRAIASLLPALQRIGGMVCIHITDWTHPEFPDQFGDGSDGPFLYADIHGDGSVILWQTQHSSILQEYTPTPLNADHFAPDGSRLPIADDN